MQAGVQGPGGVTAQGYYQRPKVLVERGPAGAVGSVGEVPKPRAGAPVPTARLPLQRER